MKKAPSCNDYLMGSRESNTWKNIKVDLIISNLNIPDLCRLLYETFIVQKCNPVIYSYN